MPNALIFYIPQSIFIHSTVFLINQFLSYIPSKKFCWSCLSCHCINNLSYPPLQALATFWETFSQISLLHLWRSFQGSWLYQRCMFSGSPSTVTGASSLALSVHRRDFLPPSMTGPILSPSTPVPWGAPCKPWPLRTWPLRGVPASAASHFS